MPCCTPSWSFSLKKTFLFILLIQVFISKAFAFDREFFLSAGLGYSSAAVKTRYLEQNDDGEIEDETESKAFGLTTRFGYRRANFEFGLLSDIGYGKVEDLSLKLPDNSKVNGDGHYRFVAISPYVKYLLPLPVVYQWRSYIGAGPSWGLQTIVMENISSGSNFSTEKRISFENFGAGVFVGIEEDLPFKQMHPVFLEVGITYMKSYKVYLIDASNFKEVKTLSSKDSHDLSGTFVFIRAGLVLF